MLVSFAGRKEKIDFRFPKSKLQLSPVLRYSFKNATKSCMTSTSTFRRFYVENAVRKQKQLLVIAKDPTVWTWSCQGPIKYTFAIFPATVPHAVHSTPGELPRVSISCNHPGDWQKFTTSKTVWGESEWSHEMMSREDAMAKQKEDEKEL